MDTRTRSRSRASDCGSSAVEASRTPAVRRPPVDGVRYGVREVELAGMHDVAGDMNLDVDVHGPASIPPRVDGLESRHTGAVRLLYSAQEGTVPGPLPEAG